MTPWLYSEYLPSRSQCQRYTPAPSTASPEAASRTVSRMARGTPSAVVVEEPKLERMSPRTTPESSSTLGPFDPSPG